MANNGKVTEIKYAEVKALVNADVPLSKIRKSSKLSDPTIAMIKKSSNIGDYLRISREESARKREALKKSKAVVVAPEPEVEKEEEPPVKEPTQYEFGKNDEQVVEIPIQDEVEMVYYVNSEKRKSLVSSLNFVLVTSLTRITKALEEINTKINNREDK
jgi:hypothetical protein